jgi:hypothetical protein
MTQADVQSKIHQPLPRGRDRLFAAYNAVAFERVARSYFNGPRSSLFYLFVTLVLVIFMFFGASLFFEAAAKSLYLDSYGLEVPGRILDVSVQTNSYGQHTKWKKLNYEFAINSGDVIKGQLNRPLHELAKLPEGNRFTVLYWGQFPNINSPRGVESNVGINAVLAGLLLLASIHFACLLRRIVRWRNSIIAASHIVRNAVAGETERKSS